MGSGKGSWLVRVSPSEACRSVEEAEGKTGTQGTDCNVPLAESVSYCIEGAWHWKCGKVVNLDQQIPQSGQESPVKKKGGASFQKGRGWENPLNYISINQLVFYYTFGDEITCLGNLSGLGMGSWSVCVWGGDGWRACTGSLLRSSH